VSCLINKIYKWFSVLIFMSNKSLQYIIGFGKSLDVPVKESSRVYQFSYNLLSLVSKTHILSFSFEGYPGAKAVILPAGQVILGKFNHKRANLGTDAFEIEAADRTQVTIRYLGYSPRDSGLS
jgi:hypothetical protein